MEFNSFNLKLKLKEYPYPYSFNVTLREAALWVTRTKEIDYFLFTRFGRVIIEYTDPCYIKETDNFIKIGVRDGRR